MKKMILCAAFSASALFAAEPSSSSYAQPNGPFVDLSGINQALNEMKPFFQNPNISINLNRTENLNQTIRHEKASYLEQAAETAVHVSAQTFFTLLIQDLYGGVKNRFFPNEEAAFQESIAQLKLQQAQNSEKERELNIEAGRANLEMMQEIRALITTTRELNALATQRSLTAAEQTQLNSANHALAMLKGLMNASAA